MAKIGDNIDLLYITLNRGYISRLTEVVFFANIVAGAVDKEAFVVQDPYQYLKMLVFLENGKYGVMECMRTVSIFADYPIARIAAARSNISSLEMPASWYKAKMFARDVSGGIACDAARIYPPSKAT